MSDSDLRAVAELTRRWNDGLDMFRAMPTQEAFFRSHVSEILCRGGNRCLAKGTLVATTGGPKPIEEMRPGDMVYDEHGDLIHVLQVFANGPRACVTITHRGMPVVECTENHAFLTKRHGRGIALRPVSRMLNKDMAFRTVHVKCPLGQVHEPHAYAIGALLGDGCSRHHGREIHISSGSADVPVAVAERLQTSGARKLHASNCTYSIGRADCRHYDEWCRGRYAHEKSVDMDVVRTWTRESLVAFVAGVIDTDGSVYVNEYDNIVISCEMQARPVIETLQYAFLALWQCTATIFRSDREKYVNGPTFSVKMASNVYTKRALKEMDPYLVTPRKKWREQYNSFVSQRSSEDCIGVSVSEDRRVADTYDIQVASLSNLYLLANGIVTHNSGKSTAAAVKFAAAARDKLVYTAEGNALEQRTPQQNGRPLIMWCVGLQLNHVGQTIYRLLFKPGLYTIIRDLETERWRAFNPTTDADRESECRPSFPLIPAHAIRENSWSWYLKADNQFRSVTLKNGTVIYAYASTADVKMGDPVDYIWIDEEIANPMHYAEWQARLSDTKGRIVWSSLSQSNPVLLRIANRASEQAAEVQRHERDHVDVQDFVLKFSANPFIDADEKRKRLEGWSEDDRRMRDEGEFVIGNRKVYPTFDKSAHAAIYDDPAMDDGISRILRSRHGEPPPEWTRELILDPGTAQPAVLFGAIPPPELWLGGEPYFVVYDEINVPRITAAQVAQRVYEKASGYIFRRFIIDGHAARQTPMGFAGTIGGNYTKEFRKRNLRSQETGHSFLPGDPSFSVRSQIVQSWLAFRPCGRPQLRVVVDRCPGFVWQMENNLRAVVRGLGGELLPQEKAADGQKQDLRVCVEYWASRYPTYVSPPLVKPDVGGPGMTALKRLRKQFSLKPRRNESVVQAGMYSKE